MMFDDEEGVVSDGEDEDEEELVYDDESFADEDE